MNLAVSPQLIKDLKNHYKDKGVLKIKGSASEIAEMKTPIVAIAEKYGLEHSESAPVVVVDDETRNLVKVTSGRFFSADQDALNLYSEIIHAPRDLNQGLVNSVGDKAKYRRLFNKDMTVPQLHGVFQRLYEYGLLDLLENNLNDAEEQERSLLPTDLGKKLTRWKSLGKNQSKFDGSNQTPAEIIDGMPDDDGKSAFGRLASKAWTAVTGSSDDTVQIVPLDNNLLPQLMEIDMMEEDTGHKKSDALKLLFGAHSMEFPGATSMLDFAFGRKKVSINTPQEAFDFKARLMSAEYDNENQDALNLFFHLIVHTKAADSVMSQEHANSVIDRLNQNGSLGERDVADNALVLKKIFNDYLSPEIVDSMFERMQRYGLIKMFEERVLGERGAIFPESLAQRYEAWSMQNESEAHPENIAIDSGTAEPSIDTQRSSPDEATVSGSNVTKIEEGIIVANSVADKQRFFDEVDFDDLINSYRDRAGLDQLVIEKNMEINATKIAKAQVENTAYAGILGASTLDTSPDYKRVELIEQITMATKRGVKATEAQTESLNLSSKAKKVYPNSWRKNLSHPKMREHIFEIVRDNDLIAEYYFMTNASDTYLRSAHQAHFLNWCEAQDIDLDEILIEYELPGVIENPKSDLELVVSSLEPEAVGSGVDLGAASDEEAGIADKFVLDDELKAKILAVAQASHKLGVSGVSLTVERYHPLAKEYGCDDFAGVSGVDKIHTQQADKYKDALWLTKLIFIDNSRSMISMTDGFNGTIAADTGRKQKANISKFFKKSNPLQLTRLFSRLNEYGLLDEMKEAALSDLSLLPRGLAKKIERWQEFHLQKDADTTQSQSNIEVIGGVPETEEESEAYLNFEKNTGVLNGPDGRDVYDEFRMRAIQGERDRDEIAQDSDSAEQPYEAPDNDERDIPRTYVPGLLPEGNGDYDDPVDLSGEFTGSGGKRRSRQVIIQEERRDLIVEALKLNPDIDNNTIREFTHPEFDTAEGLYYTVIHAETYDGNWTQIAVSTAKGDGVFLDKHRQIVDPETGRSRLGISDLREDLLIQRIKYSEDHPGNYQNRINEIVIMSPDDVPESTKTAIQWQKLKKYGDKVAKQIHNSYAEHIRMFGEGVTCEERQTSELIIKTGDMRENPDDEHPSLIFRTRWDRVVSAVREGKVQGLGHLACTDQGNTEAARKIVEKGLLQWVIENDQANELFDYLKSDVQEWLCSDDDDVYPPEAENIANGLDSVSATVAEANEVLSGVAAANDDDIIELDGKSYSRRFLMGKLGL